MHRHAVRLSGVHFDEDGGPLADPLTGTEITEIEWGHADALPFQMCVSAQTDDTHKAQFIEDVSVALGNIIGRPWVDDNRGGAGIRAAAPPAFSSKYSRRSLWEADSRTAACTVPAGAATAASDTRGHDFENDALPRPH